MVNLDTLFGVYEKHLLGRPSSLVEGVCHRILTVLRKYYSATDESILYRAAIGKSSFFIQTNSYSSPSIDEDTMDGGGQLGARLDRPIGRDRQRAL